MRYLKIKQSSNIASVFIKTQNNQLSQLHKSKSNSEKGTIAIQNAYGKTVIRSKLTSLKCRGNSSFWIPKKKSYVMKLDKKVNLFGDGKHSTYILSANFRDRSYIRNRIVYDLADYIGMKHTVDACYADLFINGRYYGLYMLNSKVAIGSGRV